MDLQPYDLHFVFSPGAHQLTAWAPGGIKRLEIEAHNETIAHDGYSHNSRCPPGTYILGTPIVKNTVPFGPWFVILEDWEECHEMAAHGRAGIGLHGGGSGLPSPLAPRQSPPWVPTHGCIRLVNQDLWTLVGMVRHAQGMGGRCYITVEAPPPATGPGPIAEPDWDSILAPDE